MIGLVPELHGKLNSQNVEQLFSQIRKNNYFLNSMSPCSHVFLMRSILHHRNERLEHLLMDRFKKGHKGEITRDALGKAILGIFALIKFIKDISI